MSAASSASGAVGRRVLGEIDETSLEEILKHLRTSWRASPLVMAHAAMTTSGSGEDGDGNATAGPPSAGARSLRDFGIPPLNELAARHLRATQSPVVSVSGRHLPLVYLIVATLVAPPHNKAVVVVDVDYRFDVARVLQCTPYPAATNNIASPTGPPAAPGRAGARGGEGHDGTPNSTDHGAGTSHAEGGEESRSGEAPQQAPPPPRVTVDDLAHIHVFYPPPPRMEDDFITAMDDSRIAELVAAAERHMLYGAHASCAREWWGTLVVGGSGQHGGEPGWGEVALTTGRRGWLRVDREEVGGFPAGISAEEALAMRADMQAAVDRAGWVARSVWGSFKFREG